MTRGLLLAFAVACLPRAEARAQAVEASTPTARPRTVEDVYAGSKLRDPFSPNQAGGGRAGGAARQFKLEDFSIHNLELKGILRDSAGSYAVLVDGGAGVGFILRDGKLFDYKNKRIPGVRGKVDYGRKTVVLMTPDNDVQTLRLGEKDGEEPERHE